MSLLLPSKPRQFSNNVSTNTITNLVTDDSGVYVIDTNTNNQHTGCEVTVHLNNRYKLSYTHISNTRDKWRRRTWSSAYQLGVVSKL